VVIKSAKFSSGMEPMGLEGEESVDGMADGEGPSGESI
jgi:hypothetical protein